MIRSYRDALDHLARFTDYERMSVPYTARRYNLARMNRLVARLGHPERAFPSLHLAGTAGKGSTAHMAEAILREAGLRTGLYTSPHLVDMRERIRLDGRPVSKAEFLATLRRMEPHLRALRPTYFETMTAAAFVIFARRRIDMAVLETGLGGRLDATNVVTPVACAITRVALDHVGRLGRTVEEIAREKAGIIKPGVEVVTGPQEARVMRVIRRRAVPRRPGIRRHGSRGSMLKFTVTGIRGDLYPCRLRAHGGHQAENAATAIALVEAAGVDLSPDVVNRALAKVRLPGRVEIVRENPRVVVDAAHNPVSARALKRALPMGRRNLLVFGVSADKDWKTMLRTLESKADLVLLTRARGSRGADPARLAGHVRSAAVTTRDVASAMRLASRLAGPRDAVWVTGSFYVAGEALEWMSRGTC